MTQSHITVLMSKADGTTEPCALVLPARLVRRLWLFSEGKCDGQIAINFAGGDIRNWDVREHERPDA